MSAWKVRIDGEWRTYATAKDASLTFMKAMLAGHEAALHDGVCIVAESKERTHVQQYVAPDDARFMYAMGRVDALGALGQLDERDARDFALGFRHVSLDRLRESFDRFERERTEVTVHEPDTR